MIPMAARFKIQCLEVISSSPTSQVSSGIIVLDSNNSFETQLMDLSAHKTIQIAQKNENLEFFATSPDRKFLAFESAIIDPSSSKIVQDNLVIASADGQRVKTIPMEKEWRGILGWLNDKNVAVNRVVLNAGNKNYPISSIMFALNPFTNERKTLPYNLPNIYDQQPLINWEGWGETMPDPTITAIIYMRWLSVKVGLYGYTLWDLQKQQALVTIPILDYPVSRWSPDGMQFIVFTLSPDFSGTELFSVGRNGQIEALTNLSNYLHGLYIPNYSWSPDGRYIAMWINIDAASGQESQNFQLTILDIVTHQVTDYCVPGYYGTSIGSHAPPPLWSQDSKQLIVEN